MENRSIRNNNPLNIEIGNNWKGEVFPQSDRRFEQFLSIQFGLRAGFVILRNYIGDGGVQRKKYNTIWTIIHRWAPPSENNSENYARFVAKKTGIGLHEVVHFSERRKMVAIVQAMCKMECGQDIDTAIIESAYDMV